MSDLSDYLAASYSINKIVGLFIIIMYCMSYER